MALARAIFVLCCCVACGPALRAEWIESLGLWIPAELDSSLISPELPLTFSFDGSIVTLNEATDIPEAQDSLRAELSSVVHTSIHVSHASVTDSAAQVLLRIGGRTDLLLSLYDSEPTGSTPEFQMKRLLAGMRAGSVEGRSWLMPGQRHLLALPPDSERLSQQRQLWRIADPDGDRALVRVIEDDGASADLASFQRRCEAVIEKSLRPTTGARSNFLESEASVRHFQSGTDRHLRALFFKLWALPACILIEGRNGVQLDRILNHILSASRRIDPPQPNEEALSVTALIDAKGRLFLAFQGREQHPVALRHTKIEVFGRWRRKENEPGSNTGGAQEHQLLCVTSSSHQLSLVEREVTIQQRPDEISVSVNGRKLPTKGFILPAPEKP